MMAIAIGGIIDGQRSHQWLKLLRQSEQVHDWTAAFHYADLFLGYDLSYLALLLGSTVLALVSYNARPRLTPYAMTEVQHQRFRRAPRSLVGLTRLGLGVSTGMILNRLRTERRFEHDHIPSTVSSSVLLEPWHAGWSFFPQLLMVAVVGTVALWAL